MTQAAALAAYGSNSPSNRNRIINGGMVLDQRNNGASVTNPVGTTYTLDRWSAYDRLVGSRFSVARNAGSVTPPAGYINYLGVTSLAATTIASGDIFYVSQRIEGLNVADLNWGTANAKTVTISFWVRSSLTGSFGGSLQNSDATRSYPFSYTISSADTWEQKSITIAGDTTGTWLTTSGVGIQLTFSLGTGSSFSGTSGAWSGANNVFMPTGSVQVLSTNGATFYITGVQLEEGSVATPFETRQYGQELALCQRYCLKYGGNTVYETFGAGLSTSTTAAWISVQFPVEMRATPAVDAVSLLSVVNGAGSNIAASSVTIGYSGTKGAGLLATVASGLTQGQATVFTANGSTAAKLVLSAEL